MEAVGLLVALALGATSLAVGARRPRVVEPATGPVVELALARPRPLPSITPVGQDARDINGYDGWVDHPGYAVTPQGILAAFRQAEMGYPQRQCDLIDDLVENDCTLRNLFEQREQAVAGKPWVMQADGAEPDAELGARVLGIALRRLPMIRVIQHLLTVNRYGWACAEIDWGITVIDGRAWIVPVWIAPVPARRFRISNYSTALMVPSATGIDELRLYADPARPAGDELRAGKWITLRRAGTWLARAGLMRSAAWPAMGKRYGFRDWLIYSQRFGLPLPVASYDETADDEAKDVAEEIVAKVGRDGGAVIPKSITLEMFDATKGGENSKSHGGLIAHCNAEMSKLVNGGTLSNDNAGSGGASYALGEVHDAGRWENTLFDAGLIHEAILTQVSAPFMAFNDLRAKPPLLRVQVIRDLDPKSRIDVASKFVNELGGNISLSQMGQELGFREPINDADRAPGMQADVPGGAVSPPKAPASPKVKA